MLQQGDVLSRYEIHSVIGQGGFGVVYKGEHRELGIEVAIKEYFPSELCVRQGGTVQPTRGEFQVPFEEGLERFLKEAKQLEKFRNCPNIVTCRDLFRANGTAYTIMEYVQGLPLSTLLERHESRGEPLTEQELLDLILPLLSGLQTVHDAGVCHRDIKPSNILVRRDDSTPILIDFGAAKQEISRHTKSLAPYTDGYAAMEQVGDGKIGPWTDIYGLGAVMWRVVAGGNPPFSPLNPTTVQKRAYAIMQGQSDPLPTAADVGQGRFSVKVLQAIDHSLVINENERTQSCTEFLGELEPSVSVAKEETDRPNLLGNKENLPPEPLEVPIQDDAINPDSAKKSNRQGLKISIALISGAVILLAVIGYFWQNQPSLITQEEYRLTGHTAFVFSMAFSPDGSQLASGSHDHTIRLWNVDTGEETRRITGHTSTVFSVAFSPDGSQLASGSRGDETIRLWNVDTGEETRRLTGHTTTVFSVAFSPDGSQLASGSWDETIILWNMDTGEETRRFYGHTGGVWSVAFSPDGSQLASGSSDETIILWDVDTGVETHRLTGHTDEVFSVAFSPDGSQLASGSSDETIRLWDVNTGVETRRLTGHTDWIRSVAFSPDGAQLASGSYDKTIRLWDVGTGEETRRLTGDTGWVTSIVFSPDGSRLASASYDDTIRIWK